MKFAFTLPGLVAGTAFLFLASGCASSASDASSPAGETYRSSPPIGSHIVRRPAAPTSSEQEREKTGERPTTGVVGVPPLNRP